MSHIMTQIFDLISPFEGREEGRKRTAVPKMCLGLIPEPKPVVHYISRAGDKSTAIYQIMYSTEKMFNGMFSLYHLIILTPGASTEAE